MHYFAVIKSNVQDHFSPLISMAIIREDGLLVYHVFETYRKFIGIEASRIPSLLIGEKGECERIAHEVIAKLALIEDVPGLKYDDGQFLSLIRSFLTDVGDDTSGTVVHMADLTTLSQFSQLLDHVWSDGDGKISLVNHQIQLNHHLMPGNAIAEVTELAEHLRVGLGLEKTFITPIEEMDEDGPSVEAVMDLGSALMGEGAVQDSEQKE